MGFEKSDLLRWAYGRVYGRPMNFSFIDEMVAGSARPLSKKEVDWMKDKKDIGAILSVREGPLEAGWVSGLRYLNVPVRNHFAPTLDQLKECVNFILTETGSGKRTAVHCFVPSTIIGSYCPNTISNIYGEVFGCDGLPHRVVRKFQHMYDGPVVQLVARGTLPVICTPEHKFLIYRPYRTLHGLPYRPDRVGKNHMDSFKAVKWHNDQPMWVEAKKLKIGDFFLSPILSLKTDSSRKLILEVRSENGNAREVKIPEQSSDLAWLFGLYAADGSSIGPGSLEITLGRSDDMERVLKTFALFGIEANAREHENYARVKVNSRTLTYNFRKWFGTSSYEKHLPDFLFSWDTKAVLEGVTDGDAYFYSKRNSMTFLSISPVLAQQVWYLSLANGNFPYIRQCKRLSSFTNASPAWTVEWRDTRAFHYTSKWSRYYCLPIMSINFDTYNGPVYNLEVSDNPTYLANGVIAHNCAAGLGRTGTVLAAYLCYKYCVSSQDAIAQVRAKRHGSIEKSQEQVITDYFNDVKSKKAA